jgi:hypothetical protein
MLHIHEDGPRPRLKARAAGGAGRAPLASKSADADATPLGGKGAPPKPRRALGDITNKGGKEVAAAGGAAGVALASKAAVKPSAKMTAPPLDFDQIERMFPASPAYVSLDASGLDLDSIIDTVLAYDPLSLATPLSCQLADPLEGLELFQPPFPALAPEPDLVSHAESPRSALDACALAGGGPLPDSVVVDGRGVVSDREEDDADEAEMELD